MPNAQSHPKQSNDQIVEKRQIVSKQGAAVEVTELELSPSAIERLTSRLAYFNVTASLTKSPAGLVPASSPAT